MGNFIPNLCDCTRKQRASGVLLKDFNEKGFCLKKGAPIFVDIISSDIAYSAKYKIHFTVGVDIELIP